MGKRGKRVREWKEKSSAEYLTRTYTLLHGNSSYQPDDLSINIRSETLSGMSYDWLVCMMGLTEQGVKHELQRTCWAQRIRITGEEQSVIYTSKSRI